MGESFKKSGKSKGNILDPGGRAIFKLTGSKGGRDIADPGGALGKVDKIETEAAAKKVSDASAQVALTNEGLLLAEASKDLQERKRTAKSKGRKSLIATGETGVRTAPAAPSTKKKTLGGA